MLTSRTETALETHQTRPLDWSSRALYPVQSYLEHQGRKLAARVDARAYLTLLCVGIDRDQLFLPHPMEAFARRLHEHGRHAEHAVLSSPYGHDGFLVEWEPMAALLIRALALPVGLGSGARVQVA